MSRAPGKTRRTGPAGGPIPDRCAICRLRMDPILGLNGYKTHPCCFPGEVSPMWEPGDRPLKVLTARRAQGANGGRPLQ